MKKAIIGRNIIAVDSMLSSCAARVPDEAENVPQVRNSSKIVADPKAFSYVDENRRTRRSRNKKAKTKNVKLYGSK